MTAISVLGSLAVLGHRMFSDCVTYLTHLLHLVATVISKLETHEDILSFLGGVNVTGVSVLGSLAI